MILAGDIGGTRTRLALFRTEGRQLIPVREENFASPDYAGLDEVIRKFIGEERGSIRSACFGIAGPVLRGRTKTTNLPWIVDADRIGKRFGIRSVLLLNDLEATAYGTLSLANKELFLLQPGQPEPRGNRAVIAAGTGLGEAILFWDGARYRPSASEGGHTDFGPRNPTEMKLLEYLLKRFPHASYERVVSGPGLLNLYQFLKESGPDEEPAWLSERLAREDPSAVISETALAGKATLCVKALDLFVSLYGAEAGNLALKALATGGVYLGGGIAPTMIKKLSDGTFLKAFTAKGRYASLLGRIPVWVILNETTALLGAARYALDHLARD